MAVRSGAGHPGVRRGRGAWLAGTIRFRDLGPLALERDGTPLPVGGARLVAALGLLLVHAGRQVSVDALAEAMWGGVTAPRSASTLDSHIWRLRRLLEAPPRPRCARRAAAARRRRLPAARRGLRWSDRMVAQHRALRVGEGPTLLELRADLLALAGDATAAVRLFAAARAHHQRAGMRWPSRELTTDLMARATAELDRVDVENAWQEGGRLTLDDLGAAVAGHAPTLPR